MQFGHDELGVFGYLVDSWGNSDGAVSLERQPRTEMLRCEPHRVMVAPQREDRPVPNCHPDPNDFPEPHPTTALGSLWYRHARWLECSAGYRTLVQSSRVPLGTEGPRGTREDQLVSAGPGDRLRFAVRRFLVRAGHGVADGVAEVDRAEFVRGLGVLRDVDAGRLVLRGDPEAHRLVDDL